MSYFICSYAECHYSECHHGECCYAESRAAFSADFFDSPFKQFILERKKNVSTGQTLSLTSIVKRKEKKFSTRASAITHFAVVIIRL